MKEKVYSSADGYLLEASTCLHADKPVFLLLPDWLDGVASADLIDGLEAQESSYVAIKYLGVDEGVFSFESTPYYIESIIHKLKEKRIDRVSIITEGIGSLFGMNVLAGDYDPKVKVDNLICSHPIVDLEFFLSNLSAHFFVESSLTGNYSTWKAELYGMLQFNNPASKFSRLPPGVDQTEPIQTYTMMERLFPKSLLVVYSEEDGQQEHHAKLLHSQVNCEKELAPVKTKTQGVQKILDRVKQLS
jgi:hypothetical protein